MAGLGGSFPVGGFGARGAAGAPAAKAVKAPVAPKVKATTAPTVDPFAPLTPAQIRQTIAKYTGSYGTPQTPAQIQASAQSMLDPVIAAITANIQGQTKQASEQIGGNAASTAKTLAAIDYAAPYTGAESKQAAIDAALQQSLTGGGSALAADLAKRLGAIGGPVVGDTAAGLASRGAAIGTNQQASGSAALSNLVANEASAKSYGAQLPGIAQRQGLQDISKVEQQGVTDIGNQTSTVMQQLPQIVENLRNAAQTLTGQKAAAAADLYQTLTGQNITKATASAGLAGSAAKAAAPDATLSRAYGYAVDSNGNPVGGKVTTLPGYTVGPGGNVVKTTTTKPPKAATVKPPSATTIAGWNKLADKWHDGEAPQYHYDSNGDPSIPAGQKGSAWIPVPGTGSAPVLYGQALTQLLSQGAPLARALKILNARWQPGDGGRPATKAMKKTAAAVKSGMGLPTNPLAPFFGAGG